MTVSVGFHFYIVSYGILCKSFCMIMCVDIYIVWGMFCPQTVLFNCALERGGDGRICN